MVTFEQPKPRQRRSPAQQNEWYAAGVTESQRKASRSEQGWYSSSHDLANGLEVVEADEETVRQMFADTQLG
jgi:uncharacterized protein (DUF305 family)